MQKKIYRHTLNLLLIISFIMILSTVFIVNKNLANGVVSGKYFWFYMSMAITFAAVLISYLLNKQKVGFSVIDLLVVSFSVSGLVVSYFNGEMVENKLFLLILVTILYLFFRIFLIQYKWSLFILTIYFISTGFVEAVWGLKQLYGYSISQHSLFKTTGSFFNPGPYAGYLAMVLPLVFYYLLSDYKILNKKFNLIFIPFYIRWVVSALTCVSIILILPSTMSRSSWISAAMGCLIAFACYFLKRKNRLGQLKDYVAKNKKRILLITGMFILLFIVSLSGLYHLKKDSADGRLLIWKTSLNTITTQPLGTGIGNFAGSYGELQAMYFKSGKGSEQEQYTAGNPEYAFNEYLQICIEFGVIPFLIFLSLIIFTLYIGLKNKKYAFVCSLLSLLIFAFSSYPFSILPFPIAFVFLMASCFVQPQKKEMRFSKSTLSTITILSILLIITGLCIYNRYPAYKAYKKWNKAKIFHNMNMNEEAKEEYKALTPYLGNEIQFLFEYAQILSKSGEYEESNFVLSKAMKISCDPMLYNIMGKNHQSVKNYVLAEKYFNKSAAIVPNRLYPYYLLAKLYEEKGEKEKVCKMVNKIHTKEAKVHSIAVDEMRKELKQMCQEYKEY